MKDKTKKATSIDEQVTTLINRGLTIDNKEFAKSKLLDIGYYRLGFYGFHFEKNPFQRHRNHIFKENSKFEQVIELYDFDNRLRHLLLFYLHKIEVNLRTRITYECSLYYVDNPCWFADDKAMRKKFVESLDKLIYNNLKEHNRVISQHHIKHKCVYAPAWKTLEFLTMGNIEVLFNSLLSSELKRKISAEYGCGISLFCNYLYVIRTIRNICSHGNCIYNYNLPTGIKNGVATSQLSLEKEDYYNLKGILFVILFLLKYISKDIADDFMDKYKALMTEDKSDNVDEIIRKTIKLFGFR